MTDRRRRPGLVRLLVATLVGGTLVGVAAATDVTFGPRAAGPSGPQAQGYAEPAPASYPSTAVLACPGTGEETGDDGGSDHHGEGAGRGTWLRAATAPEELFGQGPDRSGPGLLELDVVGHDDVKGGAVPGGQDLGVLAAAVEDGRWGTVRAGGRRAPGVVGAQLTFVPEPGARGLTLVPCSQPADVTHLVGGGAGAGRVEQVVVTNPDTDPVTVDIEVFDQGGSVRTVGGSGVVVPAQGRIVRRLEALAPAVTRPVVRVTAQGGLVTAHLADRHREGTTDLGREMVAAAATPGRELVVPALPGQGAGEHTVSLRLLAPGDAAVVELRALTGQGAFVPGLAVVRVPAGSTVEVPLDDLPDGASALRLRSDSPVTAGALLQVWPSSDEPIVLEQGTATSDGASTTSPDDGTSTTSPDDVTSTASPDDAASTTGPDAARATSDPDDPSPTRQAEPVVHPAGESAWVAAVPLSVVPLGIAVPDLQELPDPAAAALAVSVVDAADARVLWLGDDGAVRVEDLSLANDSTRVLEVRPGTEAIWVVPTGGAGIAAALHVRAEDLLGPYVGAATLPPVPWTRQVPSVVPLLP